MSYLQPVLPTETKLSILSHACMLLECGNTKIIIDPWLVGACYWGSWWNFPQANIDEKLLSEVDYVIISHVHWDHWHGLTLKKYFRGCKYIVPKEYQDRSRDDLVQLKLGEVTEANHGITMELEDGIKVTCYSFGLFLNDAAIVLETPDCKILNVNDCKIAGLPLKHLMDKHGEFDFVLRSHSTANHRACISIDEEAGKQAVDDPEHYSRAFKLFMDRVKPRYAVPFASNHCHLHKDTFDLNYLVNNPFKLKSYLERNPLKYSELMIMLPGASWSSQTGFHLVPLTCFEDPTASIAAYREEMTGTLENLYAKERKASLNARVLGKHEEHLRAIPGFVRRKTAGLVACYCVIDIDDNKQYFLLDFEEGKLREADEVAYNNANVRIDWPLAVLRGAILLKMYHHAFISKRLRFKLDRQSSRAMLDAYVSGLDLVELRVFPLTFSYFKRMFGCYVDRYREILLYFVAAYYLKIRKLPIYEVEEKIQGAG